MKNDEIIELEIIDNGMNFEGIARLNDKVVFVPYGIRGERVKAKIIKDTKSYSLANIEEMITKSKYRVKDECCDVYDKCGGCIGKHMTYGKTLEIKKDIVKNVLRKQGLDDNLVEDIYGMGVPYNYRNKVQYPVRNIDGKNMMGMFSEKSHDLIEVKDCDIQDKIINEVAKAMFDIISEEGIDAYNENTHEGDLRNIMVRRGIHTGEVLCIYVVSNEKIAKDGRMVRVVNRLKEKCKEIKGIVLNVNNTKGNVILGDKNIVMFGQDKITDKIGEYTYYISTNSFFQVNTIMAEVLFSILKEKLELDKEETLLELYSGVGTIGIFLSDSVKEVYGAEIVQDAVNMAKENLKLNNVTNTSYVVGDASIELQKMKDKNIHFDTIVVDPPRKGLDEKGIETILKLKPNKIGYVSCNPATLARDLEKLSKEYDIQSINLFDLFPWTKHIESVAVLKLKENIEI